MAQLGATAAATPRLRGEVHRIAFYLSLAATAALLAYARPDRRVVSAIYAATLLAMFGVSALYHLVVWRRPARRWMRRLDHSAIYLFIAGSATVMVSGLTPRTRAIIGGVVWAGALLGTLRFFVWRRGPKAVSVASYIALGWFGIWYWREIATQLGAATLCCVVIGGLLYSVGGVIYAKRWPNPWPATFGYHEVFHLLVVLAAAVHFAAVWRTVT